MNEKKRMAKATTPPRIPPAGYRAPVFHTMSDRDRHHLAKQLSSLFATIRAVRATEGLTPAAAAELLANILNPSAERGKVFHWLRLFARELQREHDRELAIAAPIVEPPRDGPPL
jgi:hypothetical protein